MDKFTSPDVIPFQNIQLHDVYSEQKNTQIDSTTWVENDKLSMEYSERLKHMKNFAISLSDLSVDVKLDGSTFSQDTVSIDVDRKPA